MPRNKIIPYRKDLRAKARDLRNDSTRCEIQFWLAVKNRQILGYQFHRQVPMLDFIVDFYCHELMLAIEIDGVSHESDEAKQYDASRQSRIEKYGVTFLRFSDEQIHNDLDEVLEQIRRWIVERRLRA